MRMLPITTKNTKELEQIIDKMRADREEYKRAIDEIDATFTRFGIMAESGTKPRKALKSRAAGTTRKPGRPKKGTANKLPRNPHFLAWWENEERSTADIAKLLGISKPAIYNFKNGNQRPGPKTRAKLDKLSKGKVPADSWHGAPGKAPAASKSKSAKNQVGKKSKGKNKTSVAKKGKKALAAFSNPTMLAWCQSDKPSMAEMASQIGVSKASLYGYRAGHRLPSEEVRAAIEKFSGGKVSGKSWAAN